MKLYNEFDKEQDNQAQSSHDFIRLNKKLIAQVKENKMLVEKLQMKEFTINEMERQLQSLENTYLKTELKKNRYKSKTIRYFHFMQFLKGRLDTYG